MLRIFSSTFTIHRIAIYNTHKSTYRRGMSFQYKPNVEPPKDMAVFKNLAKVASDSAKFRRVLWTGRNSQVRSFLSLYAHVLRLYVVRWLS
jgi:hypothetical protein